MFNGKLKTFKTLNSKRFKETPIGKIPEDWEVVKLGSFLELKNGERPKLVETEKIPVYGANGIMVTLQIF